MTTTMQRVAQVFGWIFLVVGVLGFFFSGSSMVADPATAPRMLGLFPVNALHNVVHLAFGVWGLMAARRFSTAKAYGQITGVAYLALAFLGFIIPATFGLMPIGGNDIWLHAILGAVLAYYGFTAREELVAARRMAA